MPGIGLIINPKSKQNKKNPARIKKIEEVFNNQGIYRLTHDMEGLREAAKEFKKEKIDILCINGGDGTNHMTLSAFMQEYEEKDFPLVALITGGTMNTYATSIGIKDNAFKMLKKVIYNYNNKIPFKTIEQPLMKINDRYGVLFGTGVIDRWMREYYKEGADGAKTAIKLILRGIYSTIMGTEEAKYYFKFEKIKLTVDGVTSKIEEFSTIAAGTIREMGLGFTPFYRAYEDMNKFHLLALAIKPLYFLPQFAKIYFGKPIKAKQFAEHLASEAILEGENIYYMIDGENLDPVNRITIKAGPIIKIII